VIAPGLSKGLSREKEDSQMGWKHRGCTIKDREIKREINFDLTFYDFENTILNKTNAIKMNATLKQSFYLIPKDNQLFSYTKFHVNKINIGKILKL
jgi:hypothetical protein